MADDRLRRCLGLPHTISLVQSTGKGAPQVVYIRNLIVRIIRDDGFICRAPAVCDMCRI